MDSTHKEVNSISNIKNRKGINIEIMPSEKNIEDIL